MFPERTPDGLAIASEGAEQAREKANGLVGASSLLGGSITETTAEKKEEENKKRSIALPGSFPSPRWTTARRVTGTK